MKTYQQMANEVLKARDQHLRKQQRRKKLFRIYGTVALSFGFSVVIGLKFWQDRENMPPVPSISEQETVNQKILTTEEKIYTSETLKSETTAIFTETRKISSTEPITENISQEENSVSVPETTKPEHFPEETVLPETVLRIEQNLIPPETKTETVTEIIPETEIVSVPATPSETISEIVPEPENPATTETLSQEVNFSATTESEDPKPEISISPENFLPERIILHMKQNDELNNVSPGTEAAAELVYYTTGIAISEMNLGGWFEEIDLTIDYSDGVQQNFQHVGEAYTIGTISPEKIVAADFGNGKYYLFRNENLSEEEFQNMIQNFEILQ